VEAPLIGDLTLRASQCVGGGSVADPIPTAQLANLFVIQNGKYPSLFTKSHRIGGDFFQSLS
jgi:hypothetical protein